MARATLLLFTLSLALLLSVSFAYYQGQGQGQQPRRSWGQSQCRLEKLNALEPTRTVEHESGKSESWDENNDQLECAGVAVTRHTIQSKGLLLPSYSNSPRLVYVIEGEGIGGLVISGCPETFQSFQQSRQHSEGGQGSRRFEEQETSRYGDQHQKVNSFRRGDIVAVPAGVPVWAYNEGSRPLTLVVIIDTSNYANQLDNKPRRFFLAGNQPSQGRQQESESTRGQEGESTGQGGSNIFSGFDVEILAEAFGVNKETARKLQGQGQGQDQRKRGFIIRVEKGLQVVRPRIQQQEQWEEERGERGVGNGVEESLCNTRFRANIGNPSRADIYSREGGHITTLTSQKMTILNYLQLSAERGHLRQNAILAPQWNINSHSVIYVIRGSARVQVVDSSGRAVFNGHLRQGQILVVPQSFVVVKKADNDEFEWVSFKTNDNAMSSQIAGKSSVFQGIPDDVLANSYEISREEARRLKYGRSDEVAVFAPRSQGRASV